MTRRVAVSELAGRPDLRAGESLLLSGVVYTARDAAHKKIDALLDAGQEPPFRLDGAVIYYAGPTPTPPGRVIGSIGPTTSGRMDAYAPRLMREGFHIMIGKGPRSPEVIAAIRQHSCAYLSAIGGAAALTARCVQRAEPVAFGDLGAEAILALTVKNLPLFVTNR